MKKNSNRCQSFRSHYAVKLIYMEGHLELGKLNHLREPSFELSRFRTVNLFNEPKMYFCSKHSLFALLDNFVLLVLRSLIKYHFLSQQKGRQLKLIMRKTNRSRKSSALQRFQNLYQLLYVTSGITYIKTMGKFVTNSFG